jgi:hypothetical protein
LESHILSLKEELLRSLSQHPEQLVLPGMPDDPWPGVKTRPSRTRNALNMIADAVDDGEWHVWHNSLAGIAITPGRNYSGGHEHCCGDRHRGPARHPVGN